MLFNAEIDIPDLTGKAVFITGGISGLGKQILITLATHEHPPSHIYFGGTNPFVGAAVISEVKTKLLPDTHLKLTFVPFDDSLLSSIKSAITHLKIDRLDILVCNSSVTIFPPGLTKDGYEMQFGVNHLAFALIVRLLLPILITTVNSRELKNTTGSGRIVIVISRQSVIRPCSATRIDFNNLKAVHESPAALRDSARYYAQSMLANHFFASEIAKRYHREGITAIAIHPGTSTGGSSLTKWIKLLVRWKRDNVSVDQGFWNVLWGTTAMNDAVINGEYYVRVGVIKKRLTKGSENEKLAVELWEWTEKELAMYF